MTVDWTEIIQSVTAGDSGLDVNTGGFMRRVYADGLDKYSERLEATGLAGRERLLDAGCGIGQWSLAAAAVCDYVVGCDLDTTRVRSAGRIARHADIGNTSFVASGLESLPFADASFDAAISYSVLYLTDFERAIAELARILAPGGRLYLSTNALPRYIYEFVTNPNPTTSFSPRRYAWKTLINTVRGRLHGLSPRAGGHAMSPGRTRRLLERNGLHILEAGIEGSIGGRGRSFCRQRYLGMTCTHDVLCEKPNL